MTKTFITRISDMKQYDSNNEIVTYKDTTEKRWIDNGVYSSLNNDDNAIFIAKNKILIGKISEINSANHFIKCSSVDAITCKNDEFLQLHNAYPELISRVKANFPPFTHPMEIDINNLKIDAKNKNRVNFFIISRIKVEDKTWLNSKLKKYDRVAIINDNSFEGLYCYDGNKLVDMVKIYNKSTNININVVGLSLAEMLTINEDNRRPDTNRSNNVDRISKIMSGIDRVGYYKFDSFCSYHDSLFNNTVYKNSNRIQPNSTTNDPDTWSNKQGDNNLIFYGPPGTGKTYNTINRALEIIGTVVKDVDRKELKKLFDTKLESGQIVFTTFHQSMTYEDFIEGIKPLPPKENEPVKYDVVDGIFKTLCNKASKDKNNNYVLIIDEINRGNVSQIFGELITLIEEDKRLYFEEKDKQENETLKATLPYSQMQFSVPQNLYIIGTMNTADRSVEALDAALRRRFSFEEMPPIPDIIKKEGKLKESGGILKIYIGGNDIEISLPELLTTINSRIEKLLDKDHQIGHSYFMSVESIDDLKVAFANKIIPQLQEYFFGDYGKIGLVLGSGFVEKKSENIMFAAFEYDEGASQFESRVVYKITDISALSNEDFMSAVNKIL